MTSVLVVRGHQATPWELRQWEHLPERFDVSYLRTSANGWDVSAVKLRPVTTATLRDRLPRGRLGDVGALLLGDRYADAAPAYRSADIVHSEELSYWFAADAARNRRRHQFKLVQTVWETLPFGDTYRRSGTSKFRAQVLEATDLFLPTTERAKVSLLLEGVPEERIVVCPPGVDIDRFAAARKAAATPPREHVIVSPGRLVWEKGHHDVLRAIALVHHGIVPAPEGVAPPRLRIIGRGPEQERLEAHAAELGIASHVEITAVPYEEMPATFANASALMLGSQSSAGGGLHPFDVPRQFWEEQFGFVFVEAMAAGLEIIATTNGAIPEVLQGEGTLVPAGDHIGMARALVAGPLSRPPGEPVSYPATLLRRYSIDAMSERLASVYDDLLRHDGNARRVKRFTPAGAWAGGKRTQPRDDAAAPKL